MTGHLFTLTAEWPGGRNAVGTIDAGKLKTQISIPEEMMGPGIGTNPDEMLLGAAATCYLITLAAMLERAHIQPEKLTLTSEGLVTVVNGVFTYEKITHRPVIVLKQDASDRDITKVQKLAEKAEQTCMISKAIRGNVEVELHITIK
ncbi:MAG: OsmC family protein [Kurthia sp.]|nr:OsmC family protein [Candidatus Kurthia equi]